MNPAARPVRRSVPSLPLTWSGLLSLLFWAAVYCDGYAFDPQNPEDVLRLLVQANADRDLSTMAKWIAHDQDTISYSIGGRKYVGWESFVRDMQQEFDSVAALEIPITYLKVWTHGDTAWFAMELNYIRYPRNEPSARTVLPLRETGVLERRHGAWILVAWHESLRSEGLPMSQANFGHFATAEPSTVQAAQKPDLSGQWEIHEEDKSYIATLDRDGNGAYTWQSGRIVTTRFHDRSWQGTWHQPGNDREGGFEVLLSEDGSQAKGVWWYTRVGDKKNIPPRQWGGSYVWRRLSPPPTSTSTP